MRWLTISACASLLWLLSSACSPLQAQFSSEFDESFRAANLSYLFGYVPDGDWRWFKAQCIQESRLRPESVSPAGASGICQIMPGAAGDASLSWADRFDAEKNIKAGAWILRRNFRTWWPRPTRLDRSRLAWASYNAGAGHIIRAQSKCDGASLWEGMAPCLPEVTGRHAAETIGYVRLIPKWYEQLSNEQ